MAKRKVKRKVKKNQRKPRRQAVGEAFARQPKPPPNPYLGMPITQFKKAWSNPLAEKAAQVISKSWLAQQQQLAQQPQPQTKNLKEALGLGVWASSLSSQMDQQGKQIDSLKELVNKRTQSRRSLVNMTEMFRSSSGSGSGSGSDRGIEEVGSGSGSDRGSAEHRPVYSGVGMTGTGPGASPRPTRPVLSGAGAGASPEKPGSGLPKIGPDGKYWCYCGSKVINTPHSIRQHKRGTKHRGFIRAMGEDPDTYFDHDRNVLASPRGRPTGRGRGRGRGRGTARPPSSSSEGEIAASGAMYPPGYPGT